MPTRNVNPTEHYDRFIEAGITSGRFHDASEVMSEGLRLLEQREQKERLKLEWLSAASKEGFNDIERGDYVSLRSDADIDEFVDRLGEEASVEFAAGQNRG